MILKPIDFTEYNKPPFFPQWLCDDETLKLVQYDDDLYADVDENTRAIAEQYDIDTIGGALQDRLGKLLYEYRNGNSDEVYRMYLKLRTMLNTANGTVNDIIKFISFFYSSEVVHIVPNYPAGIRILHDGENDTINFNSIIRQIVGAGIAYDTRELFYFSDPLLFTDIDEKRVHRNDADIFTDTSYRNGRVLRDGKTILDTQLDYLLRNGSCFRDGTITQRNGILRVPAIGRITAPIYRHSGIQDIMILIYQDKDTSDIWLSHLYRNGAVVRDGTHTRGGKATVSTNDTLVFDSVESTLIDRFPFVDTDKKNVVTNSMDAIRRDYKRNGKLTRNGTAYRASDRMIDIVEMSSTLAPQVDNWKAIIRRNGAVVRDGSETRSGYATSAILEQVTIGIRYHYFRNNAYLRNGSIKRKGGIFIPTE
jgi:hypothetical protein